MLVGYARVSTEVQELEAQIELLKKAGCEKIFYEKKSGTSTDERTELKNAIEFVRDGDTLIVTRIDRIARSIADLYIIAEQLKEKGVNFKATEQAFSIDDSMGKMVFGILGVFAEFETNLRAERQKEGIEKAKSKGVQFGAKPKLTEEQKEEVIEKIIAGENREDLATLYGVSSKTIQRIYKAYKDSKKEEKGA